jgi:hypothetical protein
MLAQYLFQYTGKRPRIAQSATRPLGQLGRAMLDSVLDRTN